jgi:putative addiction module component (TIGR02574 family)
MSNQEIISQALNLPLADRILIVNELVESFNPMNPNVEEQWKVELLKREKLLKTGELKTVSYEEFFAKDCSLSYV